MANKNTVLSTLSVLIRGWVRYSYPEVLQPKAIVLRVFRNCPTRTKYLFDAVFRIIIFFEYAFKLMLVNLMTVRPGLIWVLEHESLPTDPLYVLIVLDVMCH